MNLPNYLTVLRIFIVPLLVVVLLTPLVEDWFGVTRYAVAIGLFLIAAVTDFFDGHLARKRNQVSKFGILLDPIADKLLVASALIVLVERHLAPAWAVVVILGREFAVTGLRAFAAAEGIIISAKMSGKLKMWAQCIAIVSLLVAGATGSAPVSNFGQLLPTFWFWQVPELRHAVYDFLHFVPDTDDWRAVGYALGRFMLWVSVFASLWSLIEYFSAFVRAHFNAEIKPVKTADSEKVVESTVKQTN